MSETYIDPFKVQQIRVAVDAVCIAIKNDARHILLVKREYEPFRGMWALPGGFLKEDEELEDGAIRELREETNLSDRIQTTELIQIGAYAGLNRDPRPRRVVSIAFLVLLKQTGEIEVSNESLEVKWINLKSLNEIKLAFDHSQIIADAMRLL